MYCICKQGKRKMRKDEKKAKKIKNNVITKQNGKKNAGGGEVPIKTVADLT
jgi:hypothetical protein